MVLHIGSILGHLLFVMFINDICDVSEYKRRYGRVVFGVEKLSYYPTSIINGTREFYSLVTVTKNYFFCILMIFVISLQILNIYFMLTMLVFYVHAMIEKNYAIL